MLIIHACEQSGKPRHYNDVNAEIKAAANTEILVKNAAGHRYIGNGTSGKNITIEGVPGNALGAYLNGSRIIVKGNAQDAVGDTMNKGEIVIYGNCGDTTGYGMRSGEIYIRGYAGYRVGIHMKEYMDYYPTIVVGGRVGDFLGEYQAGGNLIVLGLGYEETNPVGSFCAAGMHGGRMYIRAKEPPFGLPKQIICKEADTGDKEEIREYVGKFCGYFGGNADEVLSSKMFKLTPDTASPYRQLYVHN